MALLEDFDSVIADMMQDFGTTATLQIYADAVYNPATADASPAKTDYVVNAILLDYPMIKNGLNTEFGTLIQTGDKQVFVQPRNKVSDNYTMPKITPNKDKILIGSELWKIATVKNVNPTNQNSILFELNVRK